MSNKTGGPAFPELGNVGCNSDWQSESGMTLRDYFAAKAMQALITGAMSDGTAFSTVSNDHETASEVAYMVADAMLRAREA
ncbi:TPA: hypothetical protein ACXE9L_000789 [Citrobacter koseri]